MNSFIPFGRSNLGAAPMSVARYCLIVVTVVVIAAVAVAVVVNTVGTVSVVAQTRIRIQPDQTFPPPLAPFAIGSLAPLGPSGECLARRR